MNVFDLRDNLIGDYSEYIKSFISIRDSRISEHVDGELDAGLLWPDPQISLNPSFAEAATIDDLVRQGVLHAECERIFRLKSDADPVGRPMQLHKHQVEAIMAARAGRNYVLTTGTGSGKSLAYMVPIVDHVLRTGQGKGIRAIVVYPMNALANSQERELEKFVKRDPGGRQLITFKRYTGQESDEEKNAIIANPPDILLTNYVMLELILTRVGERQLVKAAHGLRFLVFDEVHTYRGRQGADVALLARRASNAFGSENLLFVGTSATLGGSGSAADQRKDIAKVSSLLFGAEVGASEVITESLRRATREPNLTEPDFKRRLTERLRSASAPPSDFEAFVSDPLSAWIESTFGVTRDPSGALTRATPRTVDGPEGAGIELAELAGVDVARCSEAIRTQLLAGFRVLDPRTGFPVFPFRLHQFVSRGDTVFASLESEQERYLTVHPQQFKPDDRSRVLIPLAFCRECGQEYFSVRRIEEKDGVRFEARPPENRVVDEDQAGGYLFISTANPWPTEFSEQLERLPEDWLEESRTGPRVKSSCRAWIPKPLTIALDGRVSGGPTTAWFIPAPFRFCVTCGISYRGRLGRDFARLGTLGSEGRSTATTILTFTGIRHLRRDTSLPADTRKILSFTDNRQDASLQAGHFNDFVLVGLLRSGLYKAVAGAGTNGLTHEILTEKVFEALDLPLPLYASNPEVRFGALDDTRKALRDVLGYRLYVDLRRGWRITSPNLEHIGLLRIGYRSLDEVSRAEDVWAKAHSALANSTPEQRSEIAGVLLDFMRRGLCVRVDYLDPMTQERIVRQSDQHLIDPWAIDDSEANSLETARVLFPSSRPKREEDDRKRTDPGAVFLSPRGGFGQYLRRRLPGPEPGKRMKTDETARVIEGLLGALEVAGLVHKVREATDHSPAGYQVPAAAIIWSAGEGQKTIHDPIRVPRLPAEGGKPNRFFVNFYKTVAADARGLEAREHTAQVLSEEREKREERFRTADLPILFCSPTMELGVDIARLNVVNMRNVPPTPANYAQRSGRAGRSGQPALVLTYCSGGSGHDQYFFRRPGQMVAGRVAPPRVDLANEDLIRAHINAVWLAESGLSLGKSLKDVLDVSGERPTLALHESVKDDLKRIETLTRAQRRAHDVLSSIRGELENSPWWNPDWLDDVLRSIPASFESACDRWRTLYRAALSQFEAQSRVIMDASRPADDKKQARRLRREAEAQLELLTSQEERIAQSDFYSYRYFASEGFLPGYSFPRLPLSAFIPARRAARGTEEYLSRPRFLAIREFGPRNFIYHEGSRYVVNRVILPVRDWSETENNQPLATGSVKRCEACGYLHPLRDGSIPDLCEHCEAPLGPPMQQLFRLENVVTKRRDRINSDEEERQRQGYQVQSAIRFAEVNHRVDCRTAEVRSGDETLASLEYGHAATIWRINLGWKRRKKGSFGFVLDVERGYWAKDVASSEDDSEDDPLSRRLQRVLPYVEDHRNCLVVTPEQRTDPRVMASLQAALKSAIQVEFQLEDGELAAEPLPSDQLRNHLLLYESAEGGAGVLRRLVEEPDAFQRVARKALDLCHYDPETGEDRGGPPWRKERCEAACYDCLMSYTNQLDHSLLDRKLIGDTLRALAKALVASSPNPETREDHAARLRRLAGSGLERKWLEFVISGGHRLPTDGQKLIEAAGTRPDFVYADQHAAIYVDGPPHDYAERQGRDGQSHTRLEDLGFTVIRFHHDADWAAVIARYPHVFGKSA